MRKSDEMSYEKIMHSISHEIKKSLYEKIMHSISKEVKKALNEKSYVLRGLTPEDVVNKIKNADDGIYIYNHNYWSSKNWTIYVIINHKIVEEENFQHLDSNKSGHFYIGAIEYLEVTLKVDYPDLPVYYCDVDWNEDFQTHYELGLEQLEFMVDTFGADGVFDVMDNNEEFHSQEDEY